MEDDPTGSPGFAAYLNDIREKDYIHLGCILDQLQDLLAKNKKGDGRSEEGDLGSLIELCAGISKITYKKGSIKDRFRDLPWHNLEYLHQLLQEYSRIKDERPGNGNLGHNGEEGAWEPKEASLLLGMCKVAIPLIVHYDLPELLQRLLLIRAEAQEGHKHQPQRGSKLVNRSVVTLPPSYGLPNIVRLTGLVIPSLILQQCLISQRNH